MNGTSGGRRMGKVAETRIAKGSEAITIKKYANRRLYNTATSSYVTLDHLCKMVKDGVDFVVYDAKTGEDITRPVLTQIIVEEESKGQNLLPISFLRQLIGFYGDNLQWMVPSYLEYTMAAFASNQDRMRQTMQDTMQETVQESIGGMFPFGNLEDMGKQNMALFESAMKTFSPFVPPAPEPEDGTGKAAKAEESDDLRSLKRQVDKLQKQIENLSAPETRGEKK